MHVRFHMFLGPLRPWFPIVLRRATQQLRRLSFWVRRYEKGAPISYFLEMRPYFPSKYPFAAIYRKIDAGG